MISKPRPFCVRVNACALTRRISPARFGKIPLHRAVHRRSDPLREAARHRASRLCVGVRIPRTQARMISDLVLLQASEGNRYEPQLDRKRLATLSRSPEGSLGQAGGSRPRGGLIVWGGLNSLRHTRFPQLSKSVNTTPLTTGVVDVRVWRDEQRNAR